MNRAVNSKMSRQAAAKDASGLADRQRAPKPSGRITACKRLFPNEEERDEYDGPVGKAWISFEAR